MRTQTQIFVYRDVFFQVILWDYKCSVVADMGPPYQKHMEVEVYRGPSLSLAVLRDVCDEHVEKLTEDSIHASGDALCETCNQTLYAHPYFLGAFAFGNGRPFLRRRCDGRLVKL